MSHRLTHFLKTNHERLIFTIAINNAINGLCKATLIHPITNALKIKKQEKMWKNNTLLRPCWVNRLIVWSKNLSGGQDCVCNLVYNWGLLMGGNELPGAGQLSCKGRLRLWLLWHLLPYAVPPFLPSVKTSICHHQYILLINNFILALCPMIQKRSLILQNQLDKFLLGRDVCVRQLLTILCLLNSGESMQIIYLSKSSNIFLYK